MVLFFLLLTIVTLHVLAPPTALLSKSMERIHARFGSYMSNDAGFVKITLAELMPSFSCNVQVYKFYISLCLFTFEFRICLCFLRMLLGMLVGTVISYLFLECGPLMDREVCFDFIVNKAASIKNFQQQNCPVQIKQLP